MKNFILLLAAFFAINNPSICSASNQIITKDGKAIILKDDGSWEYASNKTDKSDAPHEIQSQKRKQTNMILLGKQAKISGTQLTFEKMSIGDKKDLKVILNSKEKASLGKQLIELRYKTREKSKNSYAGLQFKAPKRQPFLSRPPQDLHNSLTWNNPLLEFNKLVFRAKGKAGGENFDFLVQGNSAYKKSTSNRYGLKEIVQKKSFTLSNEWKEYELDLSMRTTIDSLFIVFNATKNKSDRTVYIENIRFAADEIIQCNPVKKAKEFPFYVYSDSRSLAENFIPSGWMGDWKDLTLDGNYQENPYSGDSCVKITYSGEMSNHAGWAGIFWQNPKNNWGYCPKGTGGFDLTGAKRLTFWARGETGEETITEFKIGGMNGMESKDTAYKTIDFIGLSKDWKQYSIDLDGVDLSQVIGGFSFVLGDNAPRTFYLDEIRFE